MNNKIPIKFAQHGLTLVELMVAITLTLVLTAGIIQVVLSSKHTYNLQQGISRIQENTRLVSDMLGRDLSQAGYLGCLRSLDPADSNTVSNKLVASDKDEDGNEITDEFGQVIKNPNALYDFRLAIDGIENGDRDQIIVRGTSEGLSVPMTGTLSLSPSGSFTVDNNHPAYNLLDQWDIVTLSDCSHATVFMITNDVRTSDGVVEHQTGFTPPSTHANNGLYNNNIDLEWYFVGSDIDDRVPAKLYISNIVRYELRDVRGTTSLFRDNQELVPNVSSFNVLYGITSDIKAQNPLAERYLTADQVTDWNNVVSLRLSVVVRSEDPMGADTADRHGEREFNTTIRLRNRTPGGLKA